MLSIFLFQTIIINGYSIRFREMLPTKEEDSKSEIKCNIALSDSFLVIPIKTEVSKLYQINSLQINSNFLNLLLNCSPS